MKTKVYNVVILDQSGSMSAIKNSTISGFNELLQTIKSNEVKNKESQDHNITLVTFSDPDKIQVINDCSELSAAQELNQHNYCPDCCTAPYDAMGQTPTRIERLVDAEEMAIGMVTVITDGYENASREYTGKAIHSIIGRLREKGWNFTYIGANQDVEQVAQSLNIKHTINFECNDEDTKEMWEREARSRDRRCNMMADYSIAPNITAKEYKARLKDLWDKEDTEDDKEQ